MKRKPILEIKGISKTFPGVKALDQVDFSLYPGEVHILAGENGAGKSTLSRCLLGIYQPEEGDIFYNGQKVCFRSAREASEKGIVAVHQELSMIPYLNVYENIFFGREPMLGHAGLIDKKKMRKDAGKILEELDCGDMDLEMHVKRLGIARQQMVEIAKAISFRPKVLILDEPTATLTVREIQSLFRKIKQLKEEGVSILYISHRIEEYAQIGDRITVLRDGKKIETMEIENVSEGQLIRLMVGRDIHELYKRTVTADKKVLLQVSGLSDQKHRVKVCSLNVCRGEIVGLAGLIGSGRTELARLIFGIDKPSSGEVYLNGEKVTGKTPEYMVKKGVGLLPEDRKHAGLATKASVSWNIVAASLKRFFSGSLLSEKKNDRIAREYVDQLQIATPDVRKKAGELSGGNQQKVVIAKWMAADTEVLIFDEPTRGVDVGAKKEIYKWMDFLASEGKAILLISSDLPEIMGMSDRLYVMRQGSIVGMMEREAYTDAGIGQLMMGDIKK